MGINAGQRGTRAAHGPSDSASPTRVAAPLAPDRLPQWFRIIFSAVEHEVGNSLFAFKILARKKGEGSKLAEDLIACYQRMHVLSSLKEDSSVYDLKALLSQLSQQDVDGLPVEDRAVALEKVRGAGIEVVRGFRSLLLEAWAMFSDVALTEEERTVFHFKRATKYGTMLSDVLERLLEGNQDFAVEMAEQRVFGDPSIQATCMQCATENSCICSFAEPGEGIKDARVVSNLFFSRLIISNIISNAKRASDGAGTKALIEISVARSDGGTLAIGFTDHGCGMAAEMVGMLNSGIQVSTNAYDKGSHGLGFAYCRELALRMGGRFYIRSSAEGKGTAVVLELKEASENK